MTPATVVRKLSSYTRQNQTKKALWELDTIRRTIHILDLIDDPNLRQSVQKALNRGEAYHRMRRAVSYVNSGKFRVKTEAEQQIWNECSRLIANAIIYDNTLLLSRVYEQKVAAGDLEAIQILKSTSPVAWRNVNLIGNFDFTTSSSSVDIDALAAHYENEDFWRRSMQEGEDDIPESSECQSDLFEGLGKNSLDADADLVHELADMRTMLDGRYDDIKNQKRQGQTD